MRRANDNSANRLEITDVSRVDGTTTVVLAGDLDLAAAPALRRLLAKECALQPVELVIDVSALEFIDSSGLSTLVRADKALSADGGMLVLRGASQRVRRLLEITSLAHLLEDVPPSQNGRTSLAEQTAVPVELRAGEDAGFARA